MSFTQDPVIADDGSVSFRCSTDRAAWPWLALAPTHPIAVLNMQYWISVGAAKARGTMDDAKWTALTWTDWNCGPTGAGAPVRGTASTDNNGKRDQYVLSLFDRADVPVLTMRGEGVVFRSRDFESWRAGSKKEIAPLPDFSGFEFADRHAAGCQNTGPALIGSLLDEDQTGANGPCADGLISTDNAMPPAHPYMSGSGDHVNATHLAEAAHQFVHLLEGGTLLRITGGEMRFNRYVELGRPFRIESTHHAAGQASMTISQAGRQCSEITLKYTHA